jgi:hypothetical protein
MKFFNIDQHVSVISDVAHIFKNLGHEVDDWSLSGHHWVVNKQKKEIKLNDNTFLTCSGICSQELCDLFYETYKDELCKYDGFICCYPVEFALLYEKWNKPIIIVNCIRYEHPNTENKVLWDRLNMFLIKKYEEKQLYYICNNKGDLFYSKYYLNIDGIHIPNLCEYTNEKYTGTEDQFILHNRSHIENVNKTKYLHVDQIKDKNWRYTWKKLYSYKGIIHVPYHNSSMSIFEHYTANIPMFFPSKKFAKELFYKDKIFADLTFYRLYKLEEPDDENNPNRLSNPAILDKWIDTCDFYDEENMKYIQYFDSYDHLTKLLRHVDTKKISELMAEHNVKRKENVYNSWINILKNIKNKYDL